MFLTGNRGCVQAPSDPLVRRWALQRLIRPDLMHRYVRNFREFHSARLRRLWVGWVNLWMRIQFSSGNLAYRADPCGRDIWCRPDVTLRRGHGDCEDLAAVACSLFIAGDVDAWIVVGVVQTEEGPAGHAWVEGKDAFGWFLFEATSAEVFRGRRPFEYEPHDMVGLPHAA